MHSGALHWTDNILAIQPEIKCPSGNARKHSHAHTCNMQAIVWRASLCMQWGGGGVWMQCVWISQTWQAWQAHELVWIFAEWVTRIYTTSNTRTLSHTNSNNTQTYMRVWVYEIQLSRKLALRTERTRYCSRLCIYAPATSTTGPHMHTFVPPTLYAYYSSVAIAYMDFSCVRVCMRFFFF